MLRLKREANGQGSKRALSSCHAGLHPGIGVFPHDRRVDGRDQPGRSRSVNGRRALRSQSRMPSTTGATTAGRTTARVVTTAPLGPAHPARTTPRAQTTALASLATLSVARINSNPADILVMFISPWQSRPQFQASRCMSLPAGAPTSANQSCAVASARFIRSRSSAANCSGPVLMISLSIVPVKRNGSL